MIKHGILSNLMKPQGKEVDNFFGNLKELNIIIYKREREHYQHTNPQQSSCTIERDIQFYHFGYMDIFLVTWDKFPVTHVNHSRLAVCL